MLTIIAYTSSMSRYATPCTKRVKQHHARPRVPWSACGRPRAAAGGAPWAGTPQIARDTSDTRARGGVKVKGNQRVAAATTKTSGPAAGATTPSTKNISNRARTGISQQSADIRATARGENPPSNARDHGATATATLLHLSGSLGSRLTLCGCVHQTRQVPHTKKKYPATYMHL